MQVLDMRNNQSFDIHRSQLDNIKVNNIWKANYFEVDALQGGMGGMGSMVGAVPGTKL